MSPNYGTYNRRQEVPPTEVKRRPPYMNHIIPKKTKHPFLKIKRRTEALHTLPKQTKESLLLSKLIHKSTTLCSFIGKNSVQMSLQLTATLLVKKFMLDNTCATPSHVQQPDSFAYSGTPSPEDADTRDRNTTEMTKGSMSWFFNDKRDESSRNKGL